ncbi:MAG: ATP-binding protein, partial [Gammaproteobacteria bacterium]|nr:ATP-binding protein [Gammaproteobacteria bacterium]
MLNNNSRNIARYIFGIISIVLMTTLMAGGLFIYQWTNINEKEYEASNFHFASITHVERILRELYMLQHSLAMQKQAIQNIKNNSNKNEIDLEESLYIIKENIVALNELLVSDRNRDFFILTNFLISEFPKMSGIMRKHYVSESPNFDPLFTTVNSWITKLGQLMALHNQIFSDRAEASQQESKIVYLESILLFLVIVSIAFLFVNKLKNMLVSTLLLKEKAEEQLRISNKFLIQANIDLEEFNYVASHDLQEPVRTLVSYCDLLEKDLGNTLPARAKQDIEFITDAAKRMKRLIQDLLQLSRVGRSELAMEDVDLNNCLNLALRDLGTRINDSNAVILADRLPTVKGDSVHLSRVFLNLIGNALKFVDGKIPHIELNAKREGDQWKVFIKDNGIGIEKEYLQKIFQP